MNMTPKVRKHIFKLNESFIQVEQALEEWPNTHRFKERAQNTLQLKRETLQAYIARQNVLGIMELTVPQVHGANVIWNVANA
jgi:hypothetical protein